jgi:hypothetical protein
VDPTWEEDYPWMENGSSPKKKDDSIEFEFESIDEPETGEKKDSPVETVRPKEEKTIEAKEPEISSEKIFPEVPVTPEDNNDLRKTK